MSLTNVERRKDQQVAGCVACHARGAQVSGVGLPQLVLVVVQRAPVTEAAS